MGTQGRWPGQGVQGLGRSGGGRGATGGVWGQSPRAPSGQGAADAGPLGHGRREGSRGEQSWGSAGQVNTAGIWGGEHSWNVEGRAQLELEEASTAGASTGQVSTAGIWGEWHSWNLGR